MMPDSGTRMVTALMMLGVRVRRVVAMRLTITELGWIASRVGARPSVVLEALLCEPNQVREAHAEGAREPIDHG